MPYDGYYAARDIILDLVYRDAVGPIDIDEVLQEPPLATYVCAILWPRRTQADAPGAPVVEQIDISADRAPDTDFGGCLEEEQTDVIGEANRFCPSVMALSFALPGSAATVDIAFAAGRYEVVENPVEGKEYVMREYRRVELDTRGMTISLPKRHCRITLFDGRALMQVVRRRQLPNGSSLWTISVENTRNASKSEIDQNTTALFQCRLTVRGDFLPIDNSVMTSGGADRRKQDFLHRKTHSYAVGHGCSATWDAEDVAITEIKSAFLPMSSVSQMIAVSDDRFSCFKMHSWTDAYRGAGLDELSLYIQEYAKWAAELRKQLQTIPASFQNTAQDLLKRLSECIDRLHAGIDALRENDIAWKAFCFMNKAMKRQSAKKQNKPEQYVSWYPYQLCYVLMCIVDIADEASKWREMVDLLWFPTGGGKTEAYLGVAAFTIFYRRLTKGDAGSGVTVLMRYTLRMLTAQQFERAAALICECDLIRREESLPGGEISIGLWVGGEVTPNHVVSERDDIETAETVLEKLIDGFIDDVRASPVQLAACPYCNTPLLPQNAYKIKGRQFKTFCPNDDCPFHDDLPVVTVDDDVYSRRPTLLIGTIDKFARLAWEEKTGALFAEEDMGLPPELLIQDELHLISGPLGSISGLYEIAIERLIARGGVRPKILASTATLCNAQEQIKALYGRTAFQFPPSGFDAEDSFFARIATAQERPQRMYVGYCETGGSLADAIVRIFGVARFAAQYLICCGVDAEIIDQFWTNVGYFNALRDLGSADTLIIDRVCAYAESLRRHKFYKEAEAVSMPRISNQYEYGELTSRKSAREITNVRNQLDREHYPSPAALNYVLSSNMLSVGIDINRLGLMTVYGQPKTTSEYIQATSRVGRAKPGLVIVLLHMLRTRDKGHYEQFRTYHQALNRTVEPTSATPCACRAMDKALHCVFTILIRHLCDGMRTNQAAAKFRKNRGDVIKVRDELLKMLSDRSQETAYYAREILDEFIELWHEAACSRGAHFQYQLLNKSENDTDALLIPAERSEDAKFPPTLNSMRNVDTQSGVYLKRRA